MTTLALKHAFWARAPGRILQYFVGVGGIGEAGVQVKLLFLHEIPCFTAFLWGSAASGTLGCR